MCAQNDHKERAQKCAKQLYVNHVYTERLYEEHHVLTKSNIPFNGEQSYR